MLIPASKQKAVAEAVKAAKTAERDTLVMEAANYAIPRARELYEEGISQSASKGSRQHSAQLGIEEVTGGCVYGCLGKALKERYGEGNIPFVWDWAEALKGNRKGKRWKYVHDMWVDMCESLLTDLEDNGYSVESIRMSDWRRTWEEEPTPSLLATHYLDVSW